MRFKPAIWSPIALVLSAFNLVGAGFAIGQAEPWHATIHVAFALGLGLWSQRLRQLPGGGDLDARLEAVEGEVGSMRHELNETQERLDFAERLLAQASEARRVSEH
jgi:hypothetical protein